MAQLEQEIAAFERLQGVLEAKHPAKWIVMHGANVVGAYEDFDAAASDAVKRFGRGPYLIRQVGAAPVIIPASAMYTFHHAAD